MKKKQDRWFIKIMDVAYKNYGRVMKSYENHFVFVCVVSLFCFVCLELPRRESWKRNQFLGDLDVCRSLHPTRMGCFLTSYCLGGNREAKFNGCLLDVLMDASWMFLTFSQYEFNANRISMHRLWHSSIIVGSLSSESRCCIR